MSVIEAYINGWKVTWANKKMWFALYAFNLLFALLAAYPLSSYLNKTVGDSLMFGRSFPHFDYTFWNDFLLEYGIGLDVILNYNIVLIFLVFIFWIFLMGGILNVVKNYRKDFTFSRFWRGCAMYFWRLLRLTICYFVIHGISFFIAFSWFKLMAGPLSPLEMTSEMSFISAIKIMLPIYVLLMTLVFMLHDYAKLHIVHEDRNMIFGPFLNTFSIVFRNFPRFFFLYLLNVLTFALAAGLYYLLLLPFVADSGLSIFLIFAIGQLFIFMRIGLKIFNLASANFLYRNRKGMIVEDL